jgi:putative SOS response-associated peptidase YedK
MPAILPPGAWAAWLDPTLRDPSRLTPLLGPYPADEMTVVRVGPFVNNAASDSPDCVRPDPRPEEPM